MAAVSVASAASALSRSLRVLAISGSLRAASTNAGLARYIAANHPASLEVKLADISKIPLFNSDLMDSDGNPPKDVAALRQQIQEADAVVLAVPEYNYGPSPVIVNAIDWVPPSMWKGKPVSMMSSGGTMGGSRAQLQLRQKFVFLEGHVLQRPEIMINQFGGEKVFDPEGNLISAKWQERTQAQLLALEDFARTWIAGKEAIEAAKAARESSSAAAKEVKADGSS